MLTHDLHLFPLPISFEARSHCATHDKRKLSLRIFQINRELTFGRTLILPTHPLARAISQVWQFPLCRYRHGYPRPTRGHSARSNHRAPFFHHAGISSARSYVPISSGQWWKVFPILEELESIGPYSNVQDYLLRLDDDQFMPDFKERHSVVHVRRCLYQFRQRTLMKPLLYIAHRKGVI